MTDTEKPTKERPILFSAPMVRPILSGQKTQTRRIAKPIRHPDLGNIHTPGSLVFEGEYQHVIERACPYGKPGDRLWVREAWRTYRGNDKTPPRGLTTAHRIWFEAEEPINPAAGKLRPGMFMPRWASRIDLLIKGVRIERLHSISEEDAMAEGIQPLVGSDGPNYWTVDIDTMSLNAPTARKCFEMLWVWINGLESWEANPWVWVVEFEGVTQ